MENNYFKFEEHLSSMAWLQELPKGLLTLPVDLSYRHVTISKLESGYQIYVGPINPEEGGDALVVNLDHDQALRDYYIERIEPTPVDG